MVSVELFNKSDYLNGLPQCRVTSGCPFLKPSPKFSVTGLEPGTKYRFFLSFEQGESVRTRKWKGASSEFEEPNVEHEMGIAFGDELMKEPVCFNKVRVTNKREIAKGSIIHLNYLHKYRPILKIHRFEKNGRDRWEESQDDPLKFSFEEATFLAVSAPSRDSTKKRKIEDQEDNANGKKCRSSKNKAGTQEDSQVEDSEAQQLIPDEALQVEVEVEVYADAEDEVQQAQPVQIEADVDFSSETENPIQDKAQARNQGEVCADSENKAHQTQAPVSIEAEVDFPSETENPVQDEVPQAQVQADVHAENENQIEAEVHTEPEAEASALHQIDSFIHSLSPSVLQELLKCIGESRASQVSESQPICSPEVRNQGQNEVCQVEADAENLIETEAPVDLEAEPQASQDQAQEEANPSQDHVQANPALPETQNQPGAQAQDLVPANLQVALQAFNQPSLPFSALQAQFQTILLQFLAQLPAQQGPGHSQAQVVPPFQPNHHLGVNNSMNQHQSPAQAPPGPGFPQPMDLANHQPPQGPAQAPNYQQAQFPQQPDLPNNLLLPGVNNPMNPNEEYRIVNVPMKLPVWFLNQLSHQRDYLNLILDQPFYPLPPAPPQDVPPTYNPNFPNNGPNPSL